MKSTGWSTLLLGTFLATAGSGFVRAEEAAGTAAVERAIDAVANAAETSADDADRSIDTGSIAPLVGPAKSGLTALTVREAKPLKDVVEAPAAAPAKPVEQPAVKASESVPAKADTAADGAPKTEQPKIEATVSPTSAPETASQTSSAGTASPSPVSATASPTPVSAVASPTPGGSDVVHAPIAEAKPAETVQPQAAPAVASDAPKAEAETAVVDAPKAPVVVATPDLNAAPAAAVASPVTAEPAKPSEAVAAKPVDAVAPTVKPVVDAVAPTSAVPAGTARSGAQAAAPAAEAPTLTPREADVAAAHAAEVDADALKKTVEAHAREAGPADDRKDRAAIAAFYGERKYAPLFVGTDDLTARAKVAVARLRASAEDGLEPRDYALPEMRAATPEGRAEAEYSVAVVVLRYARHLQAGRFDPSRVSDLVTAKPTKPDAAKVLAEMASGADVGAVLAAFAPPQEGYKRLKAELARLRGEVEVPVVRLPPGPVLKPGAKDARVAMLRERLGVSPVASDAEVFDPSLADVVKTFQKERGLSVSGSLNRETVAALNDESRGNGDKIADLTVNMERWRWLPRDLGALHVFVNIPDFHLDVMKDGRSIHHARVITGRPSNQTPIFSETMKYVVVNPYWNVPQSIVQKEMLGKLQGGQGLSQSFEVEVGNKSVDPSTVDWSQVTARQVSIRQRPGDGNALGNIKFMFPNQHSVYIHDTSSRGLFAQSFRALSHGCVRVQEPFSFADAVLSQEPNGLGGAQLKKMLGGAEKEVSLKVQVPVHMTYFTDFVDDAGQLQVRRDVYGHDAKMKRILGL